ncbi:MAG: hypothetical protein KBD31_05640 [Proteobacteria bacterium]|nr:hypothetical protein [Pseudomonadota bacterium]
MISLKNEIITQAPYSLFIKEFDDSAQQEKNILKRCLSSFLVSDFLDTLSLKRNLIHADKMSPSPRQDDGLSVDAYTHINEGQNSISQSKIKAQKVQKKGVKTIDLPPPPPPLQKTINQ